MKSKKKFLLLGVGVMGALALGVGATSTFAWFKAADASGKIGTVTVDNTGSTITVTNPSVSDVLVALPLDAAVSPVEATPAAVEYAHYFGKDAWGSENSGAGVSTRAGTAGTSITTGVKTNSAGLYTAYHTKTAGETLVYNATANTAFGTNNVLYRIFKVELTAPSAGATIDGVAYTQGEIRSLLSGRDAKVQFSSNSRAKYMPASSSSAATIQDGVKSGASASFTVDMDDLNDSTKSYTAVGYFAVYVEGDNSGASETTASAQTFTISVTDNAAN